MKRISTPNPQDRINQTVQVELAVGELALLYVAVGAMSTVNFERILSLSEKNMDSVLFNGISNAQLIEYLKREELFDDLAGILSDEGVDVF